MEFFGGGRGGSGVDGDRKCGEERVWEEGREVVLGWNKWEIKLIKKFKKVSFDK